MFVLVQCRVAGTAYHTKQYAVQIYFQLFFTAEQVTAHNHFVMCEFCYSRGRILVRHGSVPLCVCMRSGRFDLDRDGHPLPIRATFAAKLDFSAGSRAER